MTNASSVAPGHDSDSPNSSIAKPLARLGRRRIGAGSRWDRSVAGRSLLVALVVGISVDQMVATDPVGVAGSVAAFVATAGIAWTTRSRGWAGLWLIVACSLAPWFAIRSSPWILMPNAVAILGLLALSASGPSALVSFLSGLARVCGVVPAVIRTPRELRHAAQSVIPANSAETRSGVGRGLLLAVPLTGMVGALLASGDRFFASLLVNAGLGAVAGHGVVVAVAGAAWFGLVVRHRSLGDEVVTAGEQERRQLSLGPLESTVILGALCCLLAVYIASTLAAALAGRSYVESRTGLTYAHYARSGFFQLVAVAMIVIAVLITLHPDIDRTNGQRSLLFLGELVALFTVVVVGVCVARLQTYRSVYGLTMLRFTTTAFALWLGVVVLLVAGSLLSPVLRRSLVGAVVLSSCVALNVVSAMNPEAIVAQENIRRIGTVLREADLFDGIYLAESLTDDAIPAIVTNLDRLPVSERTAVLRFVCNDDDGEHGWSWNFSRWQADDARKSVCR